MHILRSINRTVNENSTAGVKYLKKSKKSQAPTSAANNLALTIFHAVAHVRLLTGTLKPTKPVILSIDSRGAALAEQKDDACSSKRFH
jgi:hypothetical protein